MFDAYRVVRVVARLALPLQMRLRATGAENLPAEGPALVVSNHLSLIDPLAIGVSLPRELHILAKSEVFEWPVIGGLARRCGVVPIRRRQWDIAALAAMEDLLRAGRCVLMFAEGTYPKPPRPSALLRFKVGVAWLAAQVRTPVVPLAIWGSEPIWAPERGWKPSPRPQVSIRVGAPYFPDLRANDLSHAALQPIADEMARRIRDLLPERYHGYYHT
ncbi:MAG TPA: lysophospholipid acyltransferase family protein [Ktedonobacterales bacterium]|nr:lysophospholipid acyltransferase family protein [Ktedonobacterales bacterium]